MKRNITLRIATFFLALVLISTIGMTGTLARYAQTFDGTPASVRAGKFDVVVGGTVGIPLSLEEYGGGEEVHAAAASDATIKTIIVPGSQLVPTAGAGGITITNNSEVTVDIELDSVELTNAIAPLEFSVNGGENWISFTQLEEKANKDLILDFDKTRLTPNGDIANAVPNLMIRWDFGTEGDDYQELRDNDYVAGTAEFTIAFNVKAVQVD